MPFSLATPRRPPCRYAFLSASASSSLCFCWAGSCDDCEPRLEMVRKDAPPTTQMVAARRTSFIDLCFVISFSLSGYCTFPLFLSEYQVNERANRKITEHSLRIHPRPIAQP